MTKNMKLWDSVFETEAKYTKIVNQRGGFTSIGSQYQLREATKQWGPYGAKWGVKDCKYFMCEGDLVLEAVFYYPDGEFEIATDMLFKSGNDSRKKLLTDLTTKALSKLGFNGDVFMGMFDDNKYVNSLKEKQERFSKYFKTASDYQQWMSDFRTTLDGCRSLEEINCVVKEDKNNVLALADIGVIDPKVEEKIKNFINNKISELKGE